MTFLVGLAIGVAIGALAGSKSLVGLKKEVSELLGGLAPDARDASDRLEKGLTERFREAQEIYETTLRATRQRLRRELDSARSARKD